MLICLIVFLFASAFVSTMGADSICRAAEARCNVAGWSFFVPLSLINNDDDDDDFWVGGRGGGGGGGENLTNS